MDYLATMTRGCKAMGMSAGYSSQPKFIFGPLIGIESMSGHVMADAGGAAMSMPFEDARADGVGVTYHPNV